MKSESAKPLIGIVVCGLSDNRQFVSNPYIQSVRYSGGIPILLPLIRSDTMLEQYLRLCDGFLFCGGNDITPLLFGQEPREGIGNTNITLDLFQLCADGRYRRTEEQITERAYTPKQVQAALEAIGFHVLGIYHADTEEPLHSDSERMVVVARKEA